MAAREAVKRIDVVEHAGELQPARVRLSALRTGASGSILGKEWHDRDRDVYSTLHVIRVNSLTIALYIRQDPHMIFGVSPTKDAVVVAQTRSSGGRFTIASITSIQFQARSGDDLTDLRRRLISIFNRAGKSQRSTVALLGSSSGRFKSSVEAIKAEAITELAAAESGLPVVRVTAASLKTVLGCATGQKWRARAEERFNPAGRRKNWSQGAAGAAAAALKVAEGTT